MISSPAISTGAGSFPPGLQLDSPNKAVDGPSESAGNLQPRSPADDSMTNQVNSQGEPKMGDGELKTETAQPSTPTLFEANWPYGLLLLLPLVWFCSALFRKRAPSFKHPSSDRLREVNPERQVKGQFKKAQRLQAKKTNAELKAPAVNPDQNSAVQITPPASVNSGESTIPNRDEFLISDSHENKTSNIDHSNADETFRKPSLSDPDTVQGSVEAKSVPPAKTTKKPLGSSKRFKTHEDSDKTTATPEGEFSINEDDFAFDDQDSQLSLADSDADFGFDIDDEDEELLFGGSDSSPPSEKKPSVAAAPPQISIDDGFATGLDTDSDGFGFDSQNVNLDASALESSTEAPDRKIGSDDLGFDLEEDAPTDSPALALSELTLENERLAAKVSELTLAADTAILERNAVQKNTQESDARLQELESLLAQETSAKETLVSETAELKLTINSLTHDVATIKNQLDQNLSESSQKAASDLETASDLEALAIEKADLTKANEIREAEVNSMKQELAANAEQLATAEKKLVSAIEQNESLESEIAQANQIQKELQADRDRIAAELDNQSQTHQDAIEQLQNQVAAADHDRVKDQASIERLSAELQSLQQKLDQANQTTGAPDNVAELEALREKFKLRVAQEHRKRKAAEAQVVEAEKQRNEVARSLKQLKIELANLNSN